MKLPIPTHLPHRTLHRIKMGGAAGVGVILAVATVFGAHSSSGFPETINGCSIYGSGKANEKSGKANALKNRYTFPAEDAIDEEVSLHSLLSIHVEGEEAKSDMADHFEDTKAGHIKGYVREVVMGGVDGSNCQASDPRYRDTYLYIVKNPKADRSTGVLVSVTPRLRGIKAKQGIDWSTEALKKYQGRYVEVTGWLFFDRDHWSTSRDNPEREGEVDRGTCWSLFPVTDLQELSPPSKGAVGHGEVKHGHGAKPAHASHEPAHSKGKPTDHKTPKHHEEEAHAATPKHAKPQHKPEPAHEEPKAHPTHEHEKPKTAAKPVTKPKAGHVAKPIHKPKVHVKATPVLRKRARIQPVRRTKIQHRKVVRRAVPKKPRSGIKVYR